MRPVMSFLILMSGAMCIAALSADSGRRAAVEGTWTLTRTVDGKEVDQRPGNLSRTPEGVGFLYLDGGEFQVPGEKSGSKRFTIPRGFHFRIEPQSVEDEYVVADLLLSFTDVKTESGLGFSAEKHQVDGRYKLLYDETSSFSLSLSEPEASKREKTKYTLALKLRRSK